MSSSKRGAGGARTMARTRATSQHQTTSSSKRRSWGCGNNGENKSNQPTPDSEQQHERSRGCRNNGENKSKQPTPDREQQQEIGGSVHSFPPFFFSGAPLFPFFFVLAGKANTQKQTDAEQRSNKERPFFRQDDNPPPPSSQFSD